MKKATLLLLMTTTVFLLHSQVSNPFFFLTIGQDDYTPLSDQNSLTQGIPYDDPDYIVPIGFDFEYLGYSYQTLYFGGFDAYGMELEFRGEDPNYPVCFISPCMLDIIDGQYDDNGKADSDIRYEVQGPPGNQVFKLEWSNVAFYNQDAPYTMRMNVQMWLYQSTGMIEFRYGPRTELDYNIILDYEGLPIIFTRDVNTTDFTWEAAQALLGTPAAPEFTEIQNEFDLATSTFLNALPDDGVVYAFSPLTVGLKEENKSIKVFPNPADDVLFIEREGYGKQDWHITNTSGQIVLQSQTQRQLESIDVSSLPAGVYFIQIFDNISSHVEKVVIK